MAGRRKRAAPRSKPAKPSGSQVSGRKSELERLKEQQFRLHMEPSSGSLKRQRRSHDQDELTDGESNKLVSRSDYGGTGSKLSAKLSKAGIESAASPPEVRSSRPAAGAAHVVTAGGISAAKEDKSAGYAVPPSQSEQVGSSREGAAKLNRTSDGAGVFNPSPGQEAEADGGAARAAGIADVVKSRARKSHSKATNRKAASKPRATAATRAVAPGEAAHGVVPHGSSPAPKHGSSGTPESRKENVPPSARDIPSGNKNQVENDGGKADTAVGGARGSGCEKALGKPSRRGLSRRTTVPSTNVTRGGNETQTAGEGKSTRAGRKAGIAAAAAIAADAGKNLTLHESDAEAPRHVIAGHLPVLEVIDLTSTDVPMDASKVPSGGSVGKRKREAAQKGNPRGPEMHARGTPELAVTAARGSPQEGRQSKGGQKKTAAAPGEEQRQRDAVGASPPAAVSLGDEVVVEATQPTPRSSSPLGGLLTQGAGQGEKQENPKGRLVAQQNHRQQVNDQRQKHQQQAKHHQGCQDVRGKQPVQESGDLRATNKTLMEQYKKMQAQYAALLGTLKKLRDEKIEGAEAAFDAQKQFMENKIKGSSMLIQALQEECDRVRGLLKESRVEELHLENRKLRELVTSLKLDAALLREQCVASYIASASAADGPAETAAAPAGDNGNRTNAGTCADPGGHHAPAAAGGAAAGGAAAAQGAEEGGLRLQDSERGASEPEHTLGGALVSKNFEDLGLDDASGPMALRMLLDLLGLRVVPGVGPDNSAQFYCFHDATGFNFLVGLCHNPEGLPGEGPMYYYMNVESGKIPEEQLQQDWMLARDEEDVTVLKVPKKGEADVEGSDCLLAHLLACISGKVEQSGAENAVAAEDFS